MSPLAHPKGKTPSRSAISERGSFLVLTARQPSVKPLANVVRRYIRCDGQDKGRNRLHWASPPLPNKWAGKAANPLYHTFRQKDTGDAKSRTFLQRKGSVFVQPLSLASLDSSPSRGASGETVHFAGTAKASPFGRGVTEGDGEGKPGRKEPLRSDRQALCQSDTIAVPELFVSGLALSVSSQAPRQLPQRGSHWHVG